MGISLEFAQAFDPSRRRDPSGDGTFVAAVDDGREGEIVSAPAPAAETAAIVAISTRTRIGLAT